MLEDNRITYFGETNHRNGRVRFGIKHKDRRQHFYIIGKSGVGKTALLHNLASQDIRNGAGLCVVDPHGEFVEGLLEQIPKHRLGDVVYVNPADIDFHTGFNVLELDDPEKKHLIASGLMGIFTKIWANVWSARMEYIMNNCVLALLDTPGSTLLGIPRMLVDKNYRQRIVGNIKDPVVLTFWVNEYENWQEKFRSEAIAPIQNKVGQFLSTSLVRNIVGQKKSTLNFYDMMNEKKIILVNVSKGRIGEDNSDLLGSMFITKIQLSAMERVRIPENKREDFYLYVDEFQNFATDSFADILSEARKYHLDLIIAHQYIGQLAEDNSTKVRDAVFGNAGTMVMFRVGADDAEFLEKEMEPDFMAHDMVNLPNYEIYIRLMIDGVTSRPFSAYTLAPFKPEGEVCSVAEIIEASHKRYCRPRDIVEREINEWSGMMPAEDTAASPFRPSPPAPSAAPAPAPTFRSPEVGAPSSPKASVGANEDHGIPVLAMLGIEFTPTPGQLSAMPSAPAPTAAPPAPAPVQNQETLMQRMARASTQYDSLKEIKKKIQAAGASSDLATALRLEEQPVKPVVPETAKPILLKKLEEKGETNLSDLQKTIKQVLEKDVLKKVEATPVRPEPPKVSVPPLPTPRPAGVGTPTSTQSSVGAAPAPVVPPTPKPEPPKPFVPPAPPQIVSKPAFVPPPVVPPPAPKPFIPPALPTPSNAGVGTPTSVTPSVGAVPPPEPKPIPSPVTIPPLPPVSATPPSAPKPAFTPPVQNVTVPALQVPKPETAPLRPAGGAELQGFPPKAEAGNAPNPLGSSPTPAPAPKTEQVTNQPPRQVIREVPEEVLRRTVQVTEEDKRQRFPDKNNN